MLDTLRMAARYAGGLRGFLRARPSPQECRRMVEDQLRGREQTFKNVLRRGVFGNPRSPYRRLMEHVGLDYGAVAAMIGRGGVEGALEELYEHDVYLSLEEFKAREPIRRGGLEFAPQARDFDNPLLTKHYESTTGGSRGAATRLAIDLDLLAYEAAHVSLFVSEFGLEDSPTAVWRALPPGLVGIKTCLRHLRLGRSVEEWFAWQEPARGFEDVKFRLFTLFTRTLCCEAGKPMPKPKLISLGQAHEVAGWLAEQKRNHRPALLDTNPSLGVRVCLAAKDHGLDIAGTCFRFSGEPYTEAKARIVAEAGCRAASQYSASEIGHIGLACGHPDSPDEVHLMSEKAGLIQRPKTIPGSGREVGSLLITTLMHNSPKLMLNVELGDYGCIEKRRCGCLLDQMGFDIHLSGLRSFEKLNSAGVTFLGEDLVALIEEFLPQRFGGSPLDYQFVEEERSGLSKVSLVVNPRLGPIPEQEILDAVLDRLATVPGGGLMSQVWREGRTLEIIRREPHVTGALKQLPLHVVPLESQSSIQST